nr:uncharacterized protein LOC112284551 isoform X2 [Physcomitrium patens]|eukprot:XP_024380204.1 uncharacterized protein LOC112284551 isoform X2 [Physcomitrella patens]
MIIVIQQQRWPVLVAVMLVPFVWMCPVHGAFTLFGCEKDAWPELLHTTVGDALSAINTAGIVKNVYVQPPSSGLPPANMGTPADIWVYTDGADIVSGSRMARLGRFRLCSRHEQYQARLFGCHHCIWTQGLHAHPRLSKGSCLG